MVTRSKTKIIILMNLENRRKNLLQVKKRLTVSLEKRAWEGGVGVCLGSRAAGTVPVGRTDPACPGPAAPRAPRLSRRAPRHAPTRPELRSLPGHADPRVRAGAWRPAGLCTPYRVASGPRVSTHTRTHTLAAGTPARPCPKRKQLTWGPAGMGVFCLPHSTARSRTLMPTCTHAHARLSPAGRAPILSAQASPPAGSLLWGTPGPSSPPACPRLRSAGTLGPRDAPTCALPLRVHYELRLRGCWGRTVSRTRLCPQGLPGTVCAAGGEGGSRSVRQATRQRR